MNDFRIVEELFLAALDRPASERQGFLDEKCAGNPGLRAEVESLLSFDTDKSRPLSPIVEAGAAGILDGMAMLGVRAGPYVIKALIGHGGMGSVYRASRVDEQFSREVAIKFIRTGMNTPAAVGRFLRERQILANLDHPYIGKLLDGGATERGIPYFVMEYIHGAPIDEYAEKNSLTVEARCELFRRVCEAVGYAHRHLVVHRDLKPSNVLVKEDGTPVLLDFGIAKILDDAAAMDRTRTAGTGMLTPEYASPEQLRGRPTNTATDIYSLGVVFYQLLTGSKPFQVEATTPLELARTICEDAPPRPSSVVNARHANARLRLSDDLDNIVLMALRKEPERRYRSVDQFSEDVLRYLQGRPIIAREDTFRYRATKFVQRNRAGVLAATLATAALLGAVVATSYEAHRANQALLVSREHQARAEREHGIALRQRELATASETRALEQQELATQSEKRAVERANEADRERQKARKRLTDIVDLSRHSLFDVQGTLEHLSGALEARRDIIVTTRSYLDGLASGNENDPTILAMLVTGYTQTGDVLGVPARPNLGDTKGALEAWQKARRILTRLEKIQPRNMRALLQDLGLHQRVGLVLESQGRGREALTEYGAALEVARKLAHGFPNDPNAIVQTGIVEHNLGATLGQLHDPSAVDHVRAEVAVYERVSAMVPHETEHRMGLATAISALGQTLIAEHKLREGLDQYLKSLAIREDLIRQRPNDVLGQGGLGRNLVRIATTLGAPWMENLGDRAGATQYIQRALEIFEPLRVSEPSDRRAKGDLARTLVYAGGIRQDPGQLSRGVALLVELRAEDPKQVRYKTDLALAEQLLRTAATQTDARVTR